MAAFQKLIETAKDNAPIKPPTTGIYLLNIDLFLVFKSNRFINK